MEKDNVDIAMYLFEAFKLVLPYAAMATSFWIGTITK